MGSMQNIPQLKSFPYLAVVCCSSHSRIFTRHLLIFSFFLFLNPLFSSPYFFSPSFAPSFFLLHVISLLIIPLFSSFKSSRSFLYNSFFLFHPSIIIFSILVSLLSFTSLLTSTQQVFSSKSLVTVYKTFTGIATTARCLRKLSHSHLLRPKSIFNASSGMNLAQRCPKNPQYNWGQFYH